MRRITPDNEKISTILAFALIPLSGLATDVYLPSFPEMAKAFQTTPAGIQLSLSCFLISYGIGQIFSGVIVDSFGRYRISLSALLLFTITNFVIARFPFIQLLYCMRILQGLSIAFIVVAKRALFIDVYEGAKQRHYTSMLTIVWSTAPIVAPFIGGYLQKNLGWASNFYLLGFYGLTIFLLEATFSGESIKMRQPFHLGKIIKIYQKLISSVDFSLGVSALGTCYSMLIIFGMSAPFIIERKFLFSPIATGYCALISGVALMIGGIISKTMLKKDFFPKLRMANILQWIIGILMLISGFYLSNIVVLMFFVAILHCLVGFVYNTYFTYCLVRFPQNAGTASGVVSGGSYILTSVFSYSIVSAVHVDGQSQLAICYLVLIGMLAAIFLFGKSKEHLFLFA